MYDLWTYCLLFLFLYETVTGLVKSDGMDAYDDLRVSGYKSHTDIVTKWQFFDRTSYPIDKAPFAKASVSPSKHFYSLPLKESSSILVTLRNLGDFTFNITSVTGYLHAHHRFSFYVQNSTRREINTELRPHSELSLEYRFVPLPGLPALDYVLSGDVEYSTMVPLAGGDDDEFVGFEYNNQFMNTTVSIYESNWFRFLDIQLFIMFWIIVFFWVFCGILFYEFWWIPNQMAQGKQPLPTTDFVIFCYDKYLKWIVMAVMKKMLNKKGMRSVMGLGSTLRGGNANGETVKSGSTTPSRLSGDDGWLQGTGIGKKKKNKNKKKKKN